MAPDDHSDTKLPPCDVLREMFASERALLPDGTCKRTTAGISATHAWTLYNVVLNRKPELVIEVGMAQGVSTLSILCALDETGGQLISVDPYVDWPSGKKAALYAVERAGYAERHRHIEDTSYRALPGLLDEGTQVDLGYIDGDHTYENVFIDCFYLDRMLSVGGVLGFNDAGWRPVHRVIRFLQSRRRYEEMDVGLRPDYAARTILHSILRRLLRMPRQDRYFQKREMSIV